MSEEEKLSVHATEFDNLTERQKQLMEVSHFIAEQQVSNIYDAMAAGMEPLMPLNKQEALSVLITLITKITVLWIGRIKTLDHKNDPESSLTIIDLAGYITEGVTTLIGMIHKDLEADRKAKAN